MRPRLSFASVSLCVALGSCCSLPALLAGAADDGERFKVGVQPDGRIVVPTNQLLTPAGTQITFPGRPVDLALCDEGPAIAMVQDEHDAQQTEPNMRLKPPVSDFSDCP